jgi:hypothetical protein
MSSSGRDVVVAAFLLVALPGCKQILGLEDRSESAMPDGGTPVVKPVTGACGGLLHASAACAACMDTKCCEQATSCQEDPACNPGFDCATTCGDDGTCRARCNTFFTRPDTLVDVNACRETECRAECGLACGGFGYNVPGCDTCVKETCCSSAANCAKNGECVRLDICRTNCIAGSMSCPSECEQTFSGGLEEVGIWSDCVQNTCAESCQPGRNWRCLDVKVPWLKPRSAGDVTFSLTIADILSEKPFVGSTVKACRKLDQECTTPFDVKTTDENGIVTLTAPAGTAGFDGYIDITGGDNGSGSAIFPALWYPSPNIVSAGWRGRVQFVSFASLDVLAALTMATIDPTRGHFAANAQDCNFASAGEVSFDADPKDDKTTPFYFIGGVPKTNASQTDRTSGIGGFINLPAGQLTLITARVPVDGQVKDIASVTYIIRPGSFTTTSIPPNP